MAGFIINNLLERINNGDVNARYELGLIFSCYNTEEYIKKSVEQLQLAADQGHVRALSRLGKAYELGRGVTKDEEKAAELYQQAAKKGDADGQYFLGGMYQFGWGGVKKDEEKSVELYRLAAEQGHTDAQDYLKKMHTHSLGVKKSGDKAKNEHKAKKATEVTQETLPKEQALQKINGILKQLEEKIKTIEHPYPAAKREAAILLATLQEARNNYANAQGDEQQSQTTFKDACSKAIENAKPTLEKDLSWGDYLMNLLKALYNTVKKVITIGAATSFFKPEPSKSAELVENAEQLNKISP